MVCVCVCVCVCVIIKKQQLVLSTRRVKQYRNFFLLHINFDITWFHNLHFSKEVCQITYIHTYIHTNKHTYVYKRVHLMFT